MLVSVPVAGLAVDIGTFYLIQSRLSSACDAAALAGARTLATGNDPATQSTNAQTTATAYLNANFGSGYFGTTGLTIPTPTVTLAAFSRTVAVSASVNVPHLFLRWFGGTTSKVVASATATRRDVNVVLVMDRSGSLANSGACTPLKDAGVQFVGRFAEGRDRVGLITFATSSNIDFAPATNFKTASTPVTTIINSVTCTGATNSAQALWQGYQQLAALQAPGAFNVIVFLTDGQPTAVTATMPILSSSTCSSKTDKIGVFTMTSNSSTGAAVNTYGIASRQATAQPMSTDWIAVPSADGGQTNCAFVSQPTNAYQDIASLPTLDFWGNNMTNGYLSVTTTGGRIAVANNATNAQNIENAATNAADNAAYRMRNGASPNNGFPALSNVYIYSIGLGGVGAADEDFMERVANDPQGSSFQNNKPAGLYVYAPTAGDLAEAFNRVASEILRLAK
jgi:Flp pilus assembly protein TadG